MHDCLVSVALLILAAAPPPEQPRGPDERQPEKTSPLGRTLEGLWKDGAIGTDAEYQKLGRLADAEALAPLDMRRLIVDWPLPRDLRGWTQQLSVSFEEERVTLSWSAEIGCGEESVAAEQRFASTLEKQGYRPLEKVEREALQRKDAVSFAANHAIYMRRSGQTELLVSYSAAGYTGSSTYHSGVRFHWFVRCPYGGQPPKLAEAFAALPSWMKVSYLDEKFFAMLADEPMAGLACDRHLSLKFARPVKDKLIAALEQIGFEYRKEASPHRDGSTQKTWYRFSDVTFAHVITSADGKDVRLYCQAPQDKGEPIAVKPPPLHPSLRLPPEKRPILKFDDLRFADGEVQRKAKFFHSLAEQQAQKDWQVQLYKDGRYSADPRFTAYWQTSVVKSSSYIMRVRPYRGVSISLNGRQADGADQLTTLYAAGVCVPMQGWAARVSYGLHPTREGALQPSLSAAAGLARENEVFSFDRVAGASAIPLTQHSVTVTVNESKEFHYEFQAHTAEPDFMRSLRMLSDPPEALRDEVLAGLAALRIKAREELEAGASLVMYDMTNVRSDRPPLKAPASSRPPSAQTKQAILDGVEKQLAAQEATIREHFREIHAAVQQALPMELVRKELSLDDSEGR